MGLLDSLLQESLLGVAGAEEAPKIPAQQC